MLESFLQPVSIAVETAMLLGNLVAHLAVQFNGLSDRIEYMVVCTNLKVDVAFGFFWVAAQVRKVDVDL